MTVMRQIGLRHLLVIGISPKYIKKNKKKTVLVEHEQNVRLKEIKWVFTPNISYYLQHTHKESKAKQSNVLC